MSSNLEPSSSTSAPDRASKSLGEGEFFGELALIVGAHSRTASATTRGECRLLNLDHGTLEVLLLRQPALLFAIIKRTCSYLLASEQNLVVELERRNDELRLGLDYIRRTHEELDRQELLGQTDELTGLYNRRCLVAQLPRFIERARLEARDLALLAIDLDGFKPANDSHGHAFGDQVLVNVGRLIRDAVRRSDLPCRSGGDEFVVVLWDVSESTAKSLARRLQSLLSELEHRPRPEVAAVPIGASLGGAMLHRESLRMSCCGAPIASSTTPRRHGRNRVVLVTTQSNEDSLLGLDILW